jgi:hypothetical protein
MIYNCGGYATLKQLLTVDCNATCATTMPSTYDSHFIFNGFGLLTDTNKE